MVNTKLKNLLKKLFENKEFETTITNTESVWTRNDRGEYSYVDQDVIYEFKFHVVVKAVLGEGSSAVGDINIIIDDITQDGEDYYYDFVERNYSESAWYIAELRDEFYLDYLQDLPFSVYMTVYGYDEKGKDEDDIVEESVIKKIVKEILKER
jgi:hypothetical protein